MKLSKLFAKKEPTLSFEVFPPKSSDKYESVEKATRAIAQLKPDYMSVTYGAGGGTSDFTVDIAADLKDHYGVTALAHLTCVSSSREQVRMQLGKLQARGIENILALRGDIPEGAPDRSSWAYHYSSELVRDIRAFGGDFCIGGACYPEGHTESACQKEDILHVKEKVDAGCEFLVTQMFFDNHILYNYLYKLREAGVTVPVVAGIMPITTASSVERTIKLSGTYVPQRFKAIVDRYGSDPRAMQQAGLAYATDQIIDLLANGVNAIHIYTMNKPEIAKKIQDNLSEIIPSLKGRQVQENDRK